ncbi:MAG: lipopolysaccharide transport periplasmic protein LptA [Desulfobulbaceae bacterium]|nr:lipopolysaccharide transport periplasmic protein LptA [Desulfobulbaceae bacterium]
MNIFIRSTLCAVFFLCCLIILHPFSQCMGADPISINAQRMLSTEAKNTVIFMGDVDARQGDTAITCDEMTVYYKEKTNSDDTTSQVEKMICIGNVQATSGNFLGISKKMEYYAAERKIRLIGNAKAWKGNDLVQGEIISHFLDKGVSTVEKGSASGDGKVHVIINQDK